MRWRASRSEIKPRESGLCRCPWHPSCFPAKRVTLISFQGEATGGTIVRVRRSVGTQECRIPIWSFQTPHTEYQCKTLRLFSVQRGSHGKHDSRLFPKKNRSMDETLRKVRNPSSQSGGFQLRLRRRSFPSARYFSSTLLMLLLSYFFVFECY